MKHPIGVLDEAIVLAEHVVGSKVIACNPAPHVAGTRGWAWARSTPYGITIRCVCAPPSCSG